MEFDEAFDKLFGHEGGYVNNPKDPGGETKFGISKRSYPNEDIAGMTRERAKEIYFRDFWTPVVEKTAIPPTLIFHVFDTAVNSGMRWAIKLLQRAAGIPEDQCDGVYGPFTEKCLRFVPDEKAVEWYDGQRLLFICDQPDVWWHEFGKGVTRRIALNLLLKG